MAVNRREKSKTLWGPQMLSCEEDSLGVGEIQVSAHLVVSKSLIEDIAHVFPDRTIDHPVVITTMQHAKMELVQLGQEVDAEKDFLLERFVRFATAVCQRVQKKGFWIDFIDPCSGLPMHGAGNSIYNEVQSAQILLGYDYMNAGCCKVLLHPVWTTAVYPASIVSTAPPELVINVLNELKGHNISN
eukprot:gene8851-9760_t